MTTQGIFLNDHFFSGERNILRTFYEQIFGKLPSRVEREVFFQSYDRRYASHTRIQPCTFFYFSEIEEILAKKTRRSEAVCKLEKIYQKMRNV